MSERGVFAVDRGIWEHDLFFDGEPLSRREAWLWLVSEAAWKERSRRIAGKHIELKRGQVVGSLRFIASKWGWSEPRVRRFLSALISERMIDAKTDAGITVVTICNYDNYQRVSLPTDANRESVVDAPSTQQRRNTEDIKHIEDSEADASDASASVAPIDHRKRLFNEGLAKLAAMTGKGPDACRSFVGKCLKAAGDDAVIVLGLIEDAERNQTVDPSAWIAARLKPQQGGPNGRRTVHDAANDLTARLQALDEPAPGSLCGREGEGSLRLLPPR